MNGAPEQGVENSFGLDEKSFLGEEKGLEKSEDYELSITNQEAGLVDKLKEVNQIDATSGSSPKNMTAHGHSMLVKSFIDQKLDWPVNVAFKNLSFQVTVPQVDRGINTIAKAVVRLCEALLCLGKTKKKYILDDLSGVFKAGTMTLVLGPPGSGVTTFFKALSEVLVLSSGSSLKGQIVYGGYDKDEVLVRKLAMYIDQLDIHIPTLTVRETLDFSFQCFGGEKMYLGGKVENLFASTMNSKITMKDVLKDLVEFTLRQYGLVNCSNTIIGNDLMRGCSGGERHRATTAEMMMADKPVVFFDQMSTGLDSAATFDICKDLAMTAKNLNKTYVMSLLQPAPEVYNLFDEILILSEGHMLFHDKRENVLPFFESIGYVCPPQKDIADFIQEVTTDLRVKYVKAGITKLPITNNEIAAAWKISRFNQAKLIELETFLSKKDRVQNKITDLMVVGNSPYSSDFASDFSEVLSRQRKLLYRNKPYLFARIFQCTLMSLFLGTVFYSLPENLLSGSGSAVQQRFGVLFFIALQSMIAGFALIPTVFETREIYFKQRRAYMHRVLSFVLSSFVVQLPLQILESFLLSTISFWLAGIIPLGEGAAKAYFGVTLMIFLLNLVIAGYVRLIGFLIPAKEAAFLVIGVSIAVSILFSGFIIVYDNIPNWCIWVYWLSPISYALRSIVLIVFKSEAFSEEETDYALTFYAVQKDTSYIWWGVLYLAGCIVFNIIAATIVMTLCRYDSSGKRREVSEQMILKDDDGGDLKPGHSPAPGEEHGNEERFTSSVVGKVLRSVEILPATLVFKDLSYTLPPKSKGEEPLSLLKGISGYALPGQMTALMGSSGAGKTTLMDVIAGRKTIGTIGGQILVNGTPKTAAFSNLCGYVEQNDIHSPHTSVEEAVYFSARLRQPSSVSNKTLEQFVETVLDTLELIPIRNFEVGFKQAGGLSIEQMKRLTIGVELASNPSVLFLDEPTSGLDSRAAEMIMRGIKRVARSGRTVVSTIHQPNRAIFESFDRILLLKKGGQTVYFGDLGKNSSILVSYLESIPETRKIPDQRYNPANYMLEVIGAGTSSALKRTINSDFAQIYNESELKKANDIEIERFSAIKLSGSKENEALTKLTFKASYFLQQKLLFIKTFRTYWRNPTYNLVRFLFMMVMSILWGFTYWKIAQIDDFERSSAISIIGVLFNAMVFIGAVNMNLGISAVVSEKGPFIRESASRMYRAFPFVVSFFLVEIPYLAFNTLCFASSFYFLLGLNPDAATFFAYWGVFFLYVTTLVMFGHMLVAVFPKEQIASIVAALFVSMFALFAGFLIAIRDVAPFWRFMTYIVPTRYALNAMVNVIMFCECTSEEVIDAVCNDDSLGCRLVSVQGANSAEIKVTAWSSLESIYGFEHRLGRDMMALAIFIVVFRFFTFLGYAFLNKGRR